MKNSTIYAVAVFLLCWASLLNASTKHTNKHNKPNKKKDKHENKDIEQLLSVSDLNKLLTKSDFDKNYRLLEANLNPKAEDEFKKYHIPKAIYFDAMRGAKPTKMSPVNFPEKEAFQEYARSLGISNSHHLIIYDRSGSGLFDSARTWWVFKIYGHNELSILKGGLKSWSEKNYTLSNETASFPPGNFTAKFNQSRIRNFDAVCNNLKTKKELLVDGRDRADFLKNKIPDSVNLPFTDLFTGNGSRLKDKNQLKELFSALGLKPTKAIIVSCMKGLRAAVLGFVANMLGYEKVALYPGSWLEYSLQLELLNSTASSSSSSPFNLTANAAA